MNHTNGPWRVVLENRAIADTGDCEGVVLIKTDNTKRPIVVMWDDSEETEANARRIVACVNACAGIENEVLEQYSFGVIAAEQWCAVAC